MRKKKRILFAAVDIGFRIELYSKFISQYLSDEFTAESFTKFKLAETHYKTNYTHVCEVSRHSALYVYLYTFCFFVYSLFRYDVFHFFSGETILTRKLRRFEFMVYRLLGKRLVMHFVGSDVRNPQFLFWKNEHLIPFLNGERGVKKTLPWQDALIRDSRKYADCILVSTPDLLENVPGARYYPVVIDLEKFDAEVGGVQALAERKTLTGKFTILHAPSNDKVKGTAFIHEILDRISSRFGTDVDLITPGDNIRKTGKLYSVTRYELFELMQKSDILIDQMVIGWYGLQSLEGLLCGNTVLCYVEEGLEQYLYANCPVVNVNALTLESELERRIAQSHHLTVEERLSNIEWVKKYHTIENNHADLLQAWGAKQIAAKVYS
ncbi:MAG: hypothetical protein U0Y08_05110 [Bacteroidia bacterium]